MRLFVWSALLVLIALSMACGPGSQPSDQAASPQNVELEEKPIDPTSDIEKDQVNLDNLDKPLIKDGG